MSYADAGVDISAGNALVDAIKPLAKSTRRKGADSALGGFGGLFDQHAETHGRAASALPIAARTRARAAAIAARVD